MSAAVIWHSHKGVSCEGKKRKGRGVPSISEPKMPRPALFCLLISCPPECAQIVNFAFVSFVNLYRPLLLPIELFHYHRHRLKPLNLLENSCHSESALASYLRNEQPAHFPFINRVCLELFVLFSFLRHRSTNGN